MIQAKVSDDEWPSEIPKKAHAFHDLYESCFSIPFEWKYFALFMLKMVFWFIDAFDGILVMFIQSD